MLDTSDLISGFAHSALRSTPPGSSPRFSNWIAHDLGGAIGLLDDTTPEGLMNYASKTYGLGKRVLDFGCGNAPHKSLLEAKGLRWTGLDYDASMDPTAAQRDAKLDNMVVKYDGDRFPFPDASFDSVWSYQSLEHIHSPEGTFAEIARVLVPGGILFGSTSFLEAYHARSTFCYSPYGFKLLCDRHGLTLSHVFPSIDGISLVFRSYFMILGVAQEDYGDWHKMMRGGGAFFEALRHRAEATSSQHELAEAMAQVCGQFYFIGRRNSYVPKQ